jgi:hypothetical protein
VAVFLYLTLYHPEFFFITFPVMCRGQMWLWLSPSIPLIVSIKIPQMIQESMNESNSYNAINFPVIAFFCLIM